MSTLNGSSSTIKIFERSAIHYSSSLPPRTFAQEAPEFLKQEVFIDRFAEVVIAPTGPRFVFIAHHRVGRESNNRDSVQRRVGFDAARRLATIDHRQGEIHKNQIGV